MSDSVTLFQTAKRSTTTYYYVARNLAYVGESRAVIELERSLDLGVVLYRTLSRDDPWLDPLHSSPDFQSLLARARDGFRRSSFCFEMASTGSMLWIRAWLGFPLYDNLRDDRRFAELVNRLWLL